jgi:hypothetical protein
LASPRESLNMSKKAWSGVLKNEEWWCLIILHIDEIMLSFIFVDEGHPYWATTMYNIHASMVWHGWKLDPQVNFVPLVYQTSSQLNTNTHTHTHPNDTPSSQRHHPHLCKIHEFLD